MFKSVYLLNVQNLLKTRDNGPTDIVNYSRVHATKSLLHLDNLVFLRTTKGLTKDFSSLPFSRPFFPSILLLKEKFVLEVDV